MAIGEGLRVMTAIKLQPPFAGLSSRPSDNACSGTNCAERRIGVFAYGAGYHERRDNQDYGGHN
jgi:hypothetical protein